MPNSREAERDNNKFLRTTCGLIGFIVFFLGSFLAFILAEESQDYNLIIVLAFTLLIITMLFFCWVLHESKGIHSNGDPSEQERLIQQQPEPPRQNEREQELPPQVQQEPPIDLDETASSESDSDPEMIELRKMTKPGFSAASMARTSQEILDKDKTSCESAADFQSDPTKAGPSKAAEQSSVVTESRSDDLPLKDMSALSLSDSSKPTIDSEEKQAEVSAALSKLSLDIPEKQIIEVSGPSSTDLEVKSDEKHSADIKVDDIESSKL